MTVAAFSLPGPSGTAVTPIAAKRSGFSGIGDAH